MRPILGAGVAAVAITLSVLGVGASGVSWAGSHVKMHAQASCTQDYCSSSDIVANCT